MAKAVSLTDSPFGSTNVDLLLPKSRDIRQVSLPREIRRQPSTWQVCIVSGPDSCRASAPSPSRDPVLQTFHPHIHSTSATAFDAKQ